LRAPEAKGRAQAPAPPADRPLLRLAVSRGLLGIELDAPWSLGPLRVTELQAGLPGVRFPVDLTGGVARFRHRRGELTKLSLEIHATELTAWAAPRLRGILGDAVPELVLAPIEGGLLVGIRRGSAALAFDAIVAPIDGDLRLLPERARGVGLGAPPHVLAMRALGALVGPLGRAVGSAILVPGAAAQLARHVLPAAGARAPSATSVRWEAPVAELGRFVIEARADAPPPEFSDRILRALEIAELAGEADSAAFAGDLDDARHRYLTVLERAPRHPEITQRLAWIDAVSGDRAEGALSTLIDALPAVDTGALGGQLLAAVGDHDGARVALARGARVEPYGPLAALLWLSLAQLDGEDRDAADLGERLDALDQAIARAPALDLARWARFELRLDLADLRGAKADVDHLEAAARGADARHAVFRRAADAFLARGLLVESASLFERALRYAPESVEAVLGLARSLRAAGRDRRAMDLFARAVALASRQGSTAPAAELELARALAEVAGDRPAAVARARAVPPGLPESFEARLLEGRWRAELGDLAGASLAFGRLRDAVDLAPDLDPDRRSAVAALLVEAAAIEERERVDHHAAQRLLGLALRLRPRDRAVAAEFRRVAALAQRPVAAPVIQPVSRPIERKIEIEPEPEIEPALEPEELHDAEAEDDALAQTLTDRLRGNPDDHATAMELAVVLERLGRDLDLLALLSARMDEGDDDTRFEVSPLRREVLLRLARTARNEGRASEAELYEMMANQEPESA
jgi:tetratricopeptide (TPR) repeat protein